MKYSLVMYLLLLLVQYASPVSAQQVPPLPGDPLDRTVYYTPTPYPPGVTGDNHILDGWISDVSGTFQKTGELRVGHGYASGPYEEARTYLQFDTRGLPLINGIHSVYLLLWSYPRNDGSSTMDYDWSIPKSSWASSDLSSTPMTWSTQPTLPGYGSWSGAINSGSQPQNSYWRANLAGIFGGWQIPGVVNRGLALQGPAQSNTYDTFRSSRYADDSQRPTLEITFTPPVLVPDFKMPLPAGVAWKVSTEIGGWDCEGNYDAAHDGVNYFSVDFSWRNKDPSTGNQVYGNPVDDDANIPVTPAAAGVVTKVGTDQAHPNGYYVVISHDVSLDSSKGFSTRYLHLKDPPLAIEGMAVTPAVPIGYMGNTGDSHGPHLHFGIRYDDDGGYATYASYSVVSGWLMKSFQTECVNGVSNRYYLSN